MEHPPEKPRDGKSSSMIWKKIAEIFNVLAGKKKRNRKGAKQTRTKYRAENREIDDVRTASLTISVSREKDM